MKASERQRARKWASQKPEGLLVAIPQNSSYIDALKYVPIAKEKMERCNEPVVVEGFIFTYGFFVTGEKANIFRNMTAGDYTIERC